MSQSEQLREALLDLERARLREQQRRRESTSLQAGMAVLARAADRASVLRDLFAAFRGALDFEEALVLSVGADGRLRAVAGTSETLAALDWSPQAMFAHVLAGSPAAIFDVALVPEWRAQPEAARAGVRSALLVAAGGGQQPAVLVLTHGAHGAFGPREVRVARRLAPLVAQALLKPGPGRWADYEILERIGVGGMGEVFLARQRFAGALERNVILKTILPELARHVPFVHQFLDEARVAATLNHPNIVSVYEVGESESGWYIAMEYIHGVDLMQLMQAALEMERRVPFPVVAAIVRDAARGLHHAHTRTDAAGRPLSIVHRDVSPQNLMVRLDGVTKVVDFGIAKSADRLENTVPGTFRGKLSYMSPEQAAGEDVDAASDQFSLGVVAWELCTGQRLFHSDTPVKTMRRLMSGAVPRPRAVTAGVPDAVEAIVLRMLRTRPTDRFADCAAVADALDEWLRTLAAAPETAAFVDACVRALTDRQGREGNGPSASSPRYSDEADRTVPGPSPFETFED